VRNGAAALLRVGFPDARADGQAFDFDFVCVHPRFSAANYPFSAVILRLNASL
jgi:hypothetical protein